MNNLQADTRNRSLYDGSVWKVVILASALIVLSASLIGFMSYRITEREVVKKLKESDLSVMARSVAGQVEGRIQRAEETSLLLADDPAVTEWVQGRETDGKLGALVKRKLSDLSGSYDYTNSFVVSALTFHYWAEIGQIIDTVSESDPDDQWFFQTLASGRKTSVIVDYNANRKDTFVFVNVRIGSGDRPLGIAGIGLSLKKLSDDFAGYRFVDGSHLWMVGRDGTIHLSDDFSQTGSNVSEWLMPKALEAWNGGKASEEFVFEGTDRQGRKVDMISYPVGETDMRLLVQIPRSETTGFLASIRNNTTILVVISLILSVYFFTNVSRRMADPYKRALQLNERLERMVEDRTLELADKNRLMTESISYAGRIQQSVLASEEAFKTRFPESFVFWKPRDGVGGDFYWIRETGDETWIAVGDCSGHGVPGALMTMLSVSLLGRIADQGEAGSPSEAMGMLNRLLKETLRQTERDAEGTDDGLDLGLLFLQGDRIRYAGAGIWMAYREDAGLRTVKGDKPRIGYRRTPADVAFTDHEIRLSPGAVVYLATDGIPDQNGGPRNLSLGKTSLTHWLEAYGPLPLAEQRDRFERELADFMGEQPQRDDMTLLAFRLPGKF
ncbi:SpoIIE family protein phosphatase [Cohnella caldifontis]|uniref:SpoIIE family protein phosphatase n=1 Tax=Cohnella caldifontis TaxID=3027471 RepID=UPI0023EC2392|nr:SpoIIE family protein phosphatase [Cohnella sp. YIM B05605]